MSTTEGIGKIKPLSNSNYPEWAGEMKAWLMRNGLWRLVSGKESKPEKEASDWEVKAERAAGEIYLMVDSDQRVHFRGFEEDPIQMWKLLEAAHLSKKPGARFNAYDDLFSIRKQDNESLVNLGVRIEKSMQSIQNLRTPEFTIENLDEELQCMAMIRALPEEYRHLSSSLLLVDKLDKTTILQAFRSDELNRQRQGESVNMAKGSGDKGKRVWNSRNKGGDQRWRGESRNENMLCFLCEKTGHWVQNCPEVKELKDKRKSRTEGAKKAEVERVATVTEFADQASNVSDFHVNSTSCNTFHWNTDTGATSSMTPHKNWIRNYTPYRVPVRLADNSVIYSEGIGSVRFKPLIDGRQASDIEFTKVLHVPALHNNLLAVLYLTKYKGIDVLISKSKMCFLDQNKNTLFTATIGNDETGYLDGYTIDNLEKVHLVSTLPLDLSLWHKRLGHHNYDDIKRMISKNLVDGIVLDSETKPDPICEPCLAGKMHANPFPLSQNRAKELLELIHSDVHEIGVTSPSGYNYWISFIDDHSRYKVLVPLKRKSDALMAFKSFKAYAENQTGRTIKCLRDDKGGEYMSNEFNSFLDAFGIVRAASIHVGIGLNRME